MVRMVRKQICIDEELDRALAERARLLGVSQGEVVRAALRRDIEGSEDTALHAVWSEVAAVLDSRAAGAPLAGTRTWKRDDAYGDDDGVQRGIGRGHSSRQ
jgi:hypothetical protein